MELTWNVWVMFWQIQKINAELGRQIIEEAKRLPYMGP